MNKKLTIGLVMMLLVIPLCFAEIQSLGVFKKDNCISLQQICADCTYVNFTSVLYPDSTSALDNVAATKSGSVFNYTFCNTSVVGNYLVAGIGDLGGVNTTFTYDFDVSLSGKNQTNNPIGLIVPVFSIIINLGVIFLSFKKQILNNEFTNFMLRRSLMVISLLLLAFNASIMASIAEGIGLNLTNEMFLLMEIFGWGCYTGMIILGFTTIVQFLRQLSTNKRKKRIGELNEYK